MDARDGCFYENDGTFHVGDRTVSLADGKVIDKWGVFIAMHKDYMIGNGKIDYKTPCIHVG